MKPNNNLTNTNGANPLEKPKFEKKDNFQFFEENTPVQPPPGSKPSSVYSYPNQNQNTSLLNPPKSKPTSNVVINYASPIEARNSLGNNTLDITQNTIRSRPSLAEADISKLFESPIFYQNLLKYNKQFTQELKNQVRAEMFEENRAYVEGMMRNQLNSKLKTELMEFKLQLAEFIPELVKSQSNGAIANDDGIVRVSQEIEILKDQIKGLKATREPVTQNQETPALNSLEPQLIEIKNSLAGLHNAVYTMQQNETVLHDKINYLETSFNGGRGSTSFSICEFKSS
jgi:hypothetical protein